MNLIIDKENDSLYLRLSETDVIESEEISPGIVLDFNAEGKVVGIEMLSVSKSNPQVDLSRFQLNTA